ncbi:hypothetical protein [Burkholderia sp. Bp9090]|uniref:hypothetical protein n=1 Tax=Burkholderia sp. Bp9090 TaxID=2184567 RepID=UPI000F5FF587|nr:hypothetical protein [Burkholderia sp. Bp9090]
MHRIEWERTGIARYRKIFFVVALMQHQLAIDHALSSKRRLEPDESDHVIDARGPNLCVQPMRLATHLRCRLLVEFAPALMLPRVQSTFFVAPCIAGPTDHVAHNASLSYIAWPRIDVTHSTSSAIF